MAAPNEYKNLLEQLWELHVLETKGWKMYEDQQRLLKEFPPLWKKVGKTLGHIKVEESHESKREKAWAKAEERRKAAEKARDSKNAA